MNWSCSELYSKTHDIIEAVPIIYWSEQIWLEQNELTGKGTIVLKKKKFKHWIYKFYRTHMQDLKDVTNNVHYENFRYNKLAPSSTDGNKIKPGSLSK